MSVMDHKVCTETAGGEIVHAARPVRHIAKEQHLRTREVLKNVGNDARVQQETLGKLERNTRSVRTPDTPNTLVDLKVVVGW